MSANHKISKAIIGSTDPRYAFDHAAFTASTWLDEKDGSVKSLLTIESGAAAVTLTFTPDNAENLINMAQVFLKHYQYQQAVFAGRARRPAPESEVAK